MLHSVGAPTFRKVTPNDQRLIRGSDSASGR
jgi:hypothetical protein